MKMLYPKGCIMPFLGLDLGGSKLLVLLEHNNTIDKYKINIPVLDNLEEEISFLERDLRLIRNTYVKKWGKQEFFTIGLSAAPTINSEGFIVRWPNRNYWVGFNFKNFIAGIFKTKHDITIVDDGNAAAIAEAKANNLTNMLYLGIGSGVAGGLILDGKLWRGENNCAAEFGHVIVYPGATEKCSCTKKGCLQVYASGPAILKSAFASWKNKSALDINKYAMLKNKRVLNACNIAADALAVFINNLSEILDLKTVVLGGGFALHCEVLQPLIEKQILKYLRSNQNNPVIIRAKYEDDASAMGALIMVKNTCDL